jgi:hypothetical protein
MDRKNKKVSNMTLQQAIAFLRCARAGARS